MKDELEASGCYESTIPIPLKAGSLVKLKSGGPTMTFTGKTKKGKYQCLWFDTGGNIYGYPLSQWFTLASLDVVK